MSFESQAGPGKLCEVGVGTHFFSSEVGVGTHFFSSFSHKKHNPWFLTISKVYRILTK